MRAVRASRPGPWLVLAGGLVGLATLARVDGLLLAVAPQPPGGASRLGVVAGSPRLGSASAVAALAVLAPWLARDLAVFGSPLPSAGGHTLWITSYNQQFSISQDPTAAGYLAWGAGNIIGSKLAAWVSWSAGRRCCSAAYSSSPLPMASGESAGDRSSSVHRLLRGDVRGDGRGLHLPRTKGCLLPLIAGLAALRRGLAVANLAPAASAGRPRVAVPAAAGDPPLPCRRRPGRGVRALARWLRGADRAME
jgi:hypothetical protein